MHPNSGWLAARWAAPSKVIAGTTQRHVAHYGEASPSDLPVGSNYGLKVGDDPAAVVANRRRVKVVFAGTAVCQRRANREWILG